MQINLDQILDSFNIDIDGSYLKELNICSEYTKYNCYFLFDVKSGKCFYLCPSIKNILGYTHQKVINGGFLFLKAIIDSSDFARLLIETITLIKITNCIPKKSYTANTVSIPFHAQHRDGFFLKLIIHLICINKISDIDIKILIGFIEQDVYFQSESPGIEFNITSREKEVLKLLAGGYSAKTIASELFISENTVITHRRHLIQKLQVKNSPELIKKSFELNILS